MADANSTPNSNAGSNLSNANGNQPFGDGVVDRRSGLDRRDRPGAAQGSGLERRRGPGRRRSDFARAAEEGELTTEQFNFVAAIDAFKKANDKTFPTWTDVLEVIRLLGYRKTCESELNLRNVDDWTEPATAPSGVRTITTPTGEVMDADEQRDAA